MKTRFKTLIAPYLSLPLALIPALSARRFCPIFEWVAEAHKGRASSASAGFGGRVLQASTCAARPWAQPLEQYQ